MAPLPYNNTDIYTVTYDNGLDRHSLSVRYDSFSASLSTVTSAVGDFFQVIEAGLYADFVFVSARNQVRGTNFSLPASVPSASINPGGRAILDVETPRSTTFVGRSSGGRRCSLELYALVITLPSDYLFTRGENNTFDTALDYLQGTLSPSAPVGTFLAIDGQGVTWYDRITVNYNDYWVRQARR
jgi:hypothetical protein